MSTYWDRATIAKVVFALQMCGMVIFALAFLLPSIRLFGTDNKDGSFLGWQCARIALVSVYRESSWGPLDKLLVVLSGWINPLIVLYSVLSLAGKLTKLRVVLACLLPVFLVSTWIFLFLRTHMITFIGHDFWVAGAIMIVAGEVERSKAR